MKARLREPVGIVQAPGPSAVDAAVLTGWEHVALLLALLPAENVSVLPVPEGF